LASDNFPRKLSEDLEIYCRSEPRVNLLRGVLGRANWFTVNGLRKLYHAISRGVPKMPGRPFNRRGRPKTVALLGAVLAAALLTGCTGAGGGDAPEFVWGKQGVAPGDFQKPRAIAINDQDELFIVDMTARIQVFDADGKYLRSWRTPVSANGRPTGLSIAKNGRLLVPDTHYYRVLQYEPDGTLLESATIGGEPGNEPGQFGWPTDVAEDSAGNIYVSEYGDHDRIQKFSPAGEYLLQWGGTGEEPGQFRRPQSIAIDADDRLYIADACNHRIQVFDTEGKLIEIWGKEGSAVGELYYPYGLALDGKGHLYVCEYGNERIQKFDLKGKSLGTWGGQGREPGQLRNPWAIAFDSKGRLHVVDSNNHRVQRVVF
jgi:DNA-binding beta-propeller fold protein YncE